MGASDWNTYAIACNTNAAWTNYSVEARIRFQPGAYGGGIGGRLTATNGVRYAAWIYPEGSPSPAGEKTLALVKFSTWTIWGDVPTTRMRWGSTAWPKSALVGTH